MNFLERKVAKVIFGKVVNRMPFIKRWLPLIGSAVLVLIVVLRLLGQTAVAGAVETVGSVTGVTTSSPVSPAELIAALTALFGIVRKVWAEIQKARVPVASV